MGSAFQYCAVCGVRVPECDFADGVAVVLKESSYCGECSANVTREQAPTAVTGPPADCERGRSTTRLRRRETGILLHGHSQRRQETGRCAGQTERTRSRKTVSRVRTALRKSAALRARMQDSGKQAHYAFFAAMALATAAVAVWAALA